MTQLMKSEKKRPCESLKCIKLPKFVNNQIHELHDDMNESTIIVILSNEQLLPS